MLAERGAKDNKRLRGIMPQMRQNTSEESFGALFFVFCSLYSPSKRLLFDNQNEAQSTKHKAQSTKHKARFQSIPG
jgi:hypothetical protein